MAKRKESSRHMDFGSIIDTRKKLILILKERCFTVARHMQSTMQNIYFNLEVVKSASNIDVKSFRTLTTRSPAFA